MKWCCCKRSNQAAKLEPISLPGTGTSSPFFSFSLSSLGPSDGPHPAHAGRIEAKSTLICVSGLAGKSKPRWLVGTAPEEESCPPNSLRFSMGAAGTGFHRLRQFDRADVVRAGG